MNMASKKIGLVLFGVIYFLLQTSFVFATASQDGVPPMQQPTIEAPADPTLNSFTCENLNEPHNLIVTILEESIGKSPDKNPDDATRIISCFRKTTCTKTARTQTATATAGCNSEYAKTCDPSNTSEDKKIFCSRVQVIISQNGISMLFSYLSLIYIWGAGVGATISVLYMIYGGYMFITALDNTSSVDEAKDKILQSLIGLSILILSAIILYTINPNFFTLL
jgi:cell wall-associated NlpC family hydrolase